VLGDAEAGDLIVAGPLVRLACERHLRLRDLAAGGHPRGLWFDEAAATHAIDFFERVLRLPDALDAHGEPKPFLLLPWQDFVLGSLFGWKRADGYRLHRDAFVEIGKGNGKTPMSAGVGLYMLTLDGEAAPEIYSAGPTREQAAYLFRDATRMVESSPDLSALIHVSVGNLACVDSFGFFRTCSSEHRGLDGKRAHCALLDELQEHPSAVVTTKIRANAKGRRQPLFLETTNSGHDLSSICWQHHEHSRKVLEGVVEDDNWFAFVCDLDKGDDPLTDPACWPKANPSLGHTIQPDYLQRQVDTAKNIPAETNTILRLNFCVWTKAATRFFDMAKWRACSPPPADSDLVGAPCCAALDVGPSDDLSSFVRVWLLADGRLVMRARHWMPQVALQRYADRPYRQWQDAGALVVTDGDVTDWDRIEADIRADCDASEVGEFIYDKRHAEALALRLSGTGLVCVKGAGGFFLNEAIKALSAAVVAGTFHHDGDPVMVWMADNAVARTGYNGEIRLDKRDARGRIEGIIALAMATSRVLVQPKVAREPFMFFIRG
jgi:phage terminase large subunit-like protein